MAQIPDIASVRDQLAAIAERAREFEHRYGEELAAVHPAYRESARNLVHYLALRADDIRDLQEQLAAMGLASLGRAECHVLATVGAVQATLESLASGTRAIPPARNGELGLRSARAEINIRAILGAVPEGRDVSIMVTLPREAGKDEELVAGMIAAGMNIARINCAHDDESVWAAMIENVRRAADSAGTECRIIMDLAGPKLRTGDLEPGPRVFHLRPRRDPLGRIIAPRRVRLIADDLVWHGTKAAVFPVPRECIENASEGDEIRFRDTRGKKRVFKVLDKDDKGLILEIYKGAYLQTGMKLELVRAPGDEKLGYRLGELPRIEQPILLSPGDTLMLHCDPTPGQPAREDAEGNVIEPAHIACRQPEVLGDIAVGDRVSLNDGKINGTVAAVSDYGLEITIAKAKPTGSRLRANRGINFPDSDIRLPGLTAADREGLEFVAGHADAVSLSFVRRTSDVLALKEAVEELGAPGLGLVIKIETRKAFKKLPSLLLTAMRHYPAAVMIARGDLAVEAGWERLAELQEEILWLCEAAHVPVIWATQVLERTAKRGQPSRAEISDAALAQRADCVMLNKGPHIIAAIRMLDDILRRMQGHQYKKTPRLRPLKFSA
ncbi:MAG TPA: pyruvate kinase [Woeseiaceae bacterium]|nr:pyruvate kinase [Woeseiaceae bacterium]